mmetsp:Transcript_36347/g.54240  ORF Transcript_36347/g.54240 Transcript_36347/m.54240 type:complete len:202 (-) Transcript_36347:48-653(-)|eukprot:CAMPEP_0194032722 /NCGR_PEP_ID=MMETSP0009_2-20130614/5602_1 /TAXON_ID=210454 /ORGANISM="Grammatophora oceanica, Strain CCMP 410" /LENGTH=201 /DNA_ID=CAMNT_0038673247 /DNA_START=56 /DNA_END=661 /DNA_ORIENTATION=+
MNASETKGPTGVFSKRETSLQDLYRMERRQQVRSQSLRKLGKSMSSILHLKERSSKKEAKKTQMTNNLGHSSCPIKFELKHRNSLDMMMRRPDSKVTTGQANDEAPSDTAMIGHSSCPIAFGETYDSSMGSWSAQGDKAKPIKSSLKKVPSENDVKQNSNEVGHDSCPNTFDRFEIVHRNSLEMMGARPDSWKELDSLVQY